MERATTEVEIVAKTQRSFYLNDDLSRLLEAHSKATGASFTRMMTAAVLKYLFTHPSGPGSEWMEHAVSLELGEITVGDMPHQRANLVTAEGLRDSTILHDDPQEIAEDRSTRLRKMHASFTNMMRRSGDDPVQKIIDHWTEARKRSPGD